MSITQSFQTTPSALSRKSIIVRLVCTIVRNRHTLLRQWINGAAEVVAYHRRARRVASLRVPPLNGAPRHPAFTPGADHQSGAPIKKGAANGTFSATTSFFC
jgi:hypothetical protein